MMPLIYIKKIYKIETHSLFLKILANRIEIYYILPYSDQKLLTKNLQETILNSKILNVFFLKSGMRVQLWSLIFNMWMFHLV